MRCDELLFDIEIECDEEPVQLEPSPVYKNERLKKITVIKSRAPRR
jgi:hypothetical protein